MKHQITISKDGWVSLNETGKAEGTMQGLGDIGVDVEILDERGTKTKVSKCCGQPVIETTRTDPTGDKYRDVFCSGVDGCGQWCTVVDPVQLPSREAVEKAVEQSIIDDHVTMERARIHQELFELTWEKNDEGVKEIEEKVAYVRVSDIIKIIKRK
jgi:hypothetical protein